jgi:hypothetical protein
MLLPIPKESSFRRILVIRTRPSIAGPRLKAPERFADTAAELAESREAEATTARHAYASVLASIIGYTSYWYTAKRRVPFAVAVI